MIEGDGGRRTKQDYAARRRRQLAIPYVFVVMILSMFALRYTVSDTGRFAPFVAVGFVALFAGAIVFSFMNWRCPSCNGYLGRSLVHRVCPHCGVRFQ